MRLAGVLPISKNPELVIVYDLNDYPVKARCSSCGKEMPARKGWFTSAAANLAWFADQFRLHLESDDPDGGSAMPDPARLREAA
jgi:hypothetical protein